MAKINVRAKGARLEYERLHFWKTLNYDVYTSRNQSKRADDMGIDLVGIPVIEQCKNGYENGLNYVKILSEIKTKIHKSEYKDLKRVIIHKKKSYYCAIMIRDEFDKLFKLTLNDILTCKYFHLTKDLIIIDILLYNNLCKAVFTTESNL